MDNVEGAVSYFEEGFSCAQAVLATYAPQLGLDRETALKVAGAFGGGMARMGQTCGAVTGALMSIGLQNGKTVADDEETTEACYDLAKEFAEQFRSRNGSTICKELLGYDISSLEERKIADEKKLFETRCPEFVHDAAEILEQLLGD